MAIACEEVFLYIEPNLSQHLLSCTADWLKSEKHGELRVYEM